MALWLLVMLVCSAFPVIASSGEPDVRLPTGLVTMRVTGGIDSFFDMSLSDIPVGFDITNGTYQGWCVQRSALMRLHVNHSVFLYSSYDSEMPIQFQSSDWDKVNYVINHKQGGKESIQKVIWYYICHSSYPTNDTPAQAMIADANTNGADFVPQPGQKIAILDDMIDGIYSIQRTFLELSLPSAVTLGDLVWNDYDADGIQDAGEPGIPGVTVQLYNASNAMVATTIININGYYSFSNLVSGNYSIQFVLPQGYRFSPQHQGIDDTKDSDANPSTGRTPMIVVNQSTHDTSWDAGMYLLNEQGGPTPPSYPSNHAPTADGTAGEPYKGFVGQALQLNGSRSYDRDGRIVSWHWSFGDGTTASGSIVTHVYTDVGTYTVLLTVTDDDGATDTFQTIAQIKISARAPLKPTLSGPVEGTRNVSYEFSMVTTDPDNDDVRYIILWGDGSQDISPFNRSGHMIQMLHHWNSFGFYTIQVSAQDSSNATSDKYSMRVAIDVLYVQHLGYLINVDGVGPFDMFFSNKTGNLTRVQVEKNGVYSIDSNGTGAFNYQYDVQSNTLSKYPEQLEPQYTMLLVGMGVVILFIILIAFFGRRKIREK